jgi:hypothetical protein
MTDITFFNLLCDPTYLKPIIRYWLSVTSKKFTSFSLNDLLTFWFDAWARDAATSFSLNWYEDSKIAGVCLFDAREKKLVKKKNMTTQEKEEARLEKERTKMLQFTFYIPKEILCAFPPLAAAFNELLINNMFTQNKLENKQFICLFKFKYNGYCQVRRIIKLVFNTLKEEISLTEKEYILFNYYLFKYRRDYPYFDGLFIKDGNGV